MKSPEKLQKLLHTLSDNNRLRIINYLGTQEVSVGAIVEATDLSQPLVSHHLRTLKKNAIVTTRRKGPFIYYRLSFPELLDVLGILAEMAQNTIMFKFASRKLHNYYQSLQKVIKGSR